MIFSSTFFHFKILSHSSLRSRRLEVVGERENGSVRGRNATRVFFSRARFFLCPQTLQVLIREGTNNFWPYELTHTFPFNILISNKGKNGT